MKPPPTRGSGKQRHGLLVASCGFYWAALGENNTKSHEILCSVEMLWQDLPGVVFNLA